MRIGSASLPGPGDSRIVLTLLLAFRLPLQLFQQLGKPAKECRRAKPLLVVESRRSCQHRSRRNISVQSGLGDGYHSVSDVAVAGDPDLSGQDYIFSDVRGACEPHLGAEQGIVGDGRSVSDLHEVVDLDSIANPGRADAG